MAQTAVVPFAAELQGGFAQDETHGEAPDKIRHTTRLRAEARIASGEKGKTSESIHLAIPVEEVSC